MNKILGISIQPRTKTETIEFIQNHLGTSRFTQIVSLNPEILVTASKNSQFHIILESADIKLVDGVGISLAGKILKINTGERLSGVDLMKELIEISDKMKLKVLIIGGFDTVADDLAAKLSSHYKSAEFKGVKGYANVTLPSGSEEQTIIHILETYKPNLVFVAFGAPSQEFWIEKHKNLLKNSVCMGVGGSVDYLAGKVPRAPRLLQMLGLEWLFRLTVQPWRWKRQLKLITFIYFVLKQKLNHTS